MIDNSLPEFVNFYPLMAIQAARRSSRVGGGYRLYVLAKALDQEGRGSVTRERLRAYVLSLGVHPRTWERWVIEARNNDLLTDWQRKNGEWMFAIPSPGAAAYSMNCESVGSCKVTLRASLLIGRGWKAYVWAAYEATHSGRPISRERMQKIVNVPVSTQRYRDRRAGVTRKANYAKLLLKADALPMLKEYGHHKGLHVRKDGYIGSRKPDSRFTYFAERTGRGRARKANATLHRMKRLDGLSLERQAFSFDVPPELAATNSVYVRLFNYTHDQRAATEKKLARMSGPPIRELYEYSHTARSGADVWRQC